MISDSQVQADLVAYYKLLPAILAVLTGAQGVEVREDQYQGTVFAYPAIRVAIHQQIHLPDPGPCDLARLTFSVRSYAEGGSSKPADDIAGVVNGSTHLRTIRGTGWYCPRMRSTGLVGAIRTAEKLWRAEAFFSGVVYPT